MSEIKLTEEQEREIWENSPEWAEWFAIAKDQQYYYYQFKPKMHYPSDGGMNYYISSEGLSEFAKAVNCNMFATKRVTDIRFKRPENCPKKEESEIKPWQGGSINESIFNSMSEDDKVEIGSIKFWEMISDKYNVVSWNCVDKEFVLVNKDEKKPLDMRYFKCSDINQNTVDFNCTRGTVRYKRNYMDDGSAKFASDNNLKQNKDTKEHNTFKPEYYYRAGDQYTPNIISDAYNLEGSKNQALKYILRAGYKPNSDYPNDMRMAEIVDLKKCIGQVEDRIAFLEGLK